jgi:hypothetical protein
MPFYILHLAAIILCFAYCVYCVARSLSEKAVSGPDPNGDQEVEVAQGLDDETKTERVRLYLERFRERARGATKTALLWIAALAIVWITGLEGLRRDVTNRLSAVEENNRAKQALENEAAVYHLSKSSSYQLINVMKTHIKEEEGLDNLRRERDAARGAGDEDGTKELSSRVRRIENRIKEEGLTIDQRRRALQELESSTALKINNFKDQFDKIEKRRGELQQALKTLKEQRRAVSFDILGQKFEVPAVYAPIIWCLFLLGLVFYLARARASLIILCVRALAMLRSISSTSPNHLKNITADAPWWLAPLPPARVKLEQFAGNTEISRGALRSHQLLEAVGWHREYHRLISLLSILCLFILILAQARIVWLGLSMSRQIGDAYERSYIPVVFLAIIVLTAYAARLWISPSHALGREVKTDTKKITFSGILLIISALGLLLLFALTWNYHGIGEDLGRHIRASLLMIILYSFIAVATLSWYLWATFNTDAYFKVDGEGSVDERRRRLLFGAAAVMGVIALSFFLFRTKKEGRRAGSPRFIKNKKQRNERTMGLENGYHLNTKTSVIHYVTAAGLLVGIPSDARIRLERFVPFEALWVPTKSKSKVMMPKTAYRLGEQNSNGNYLSVESVPDNKQAAVAVAQRPSTSKETPEVVPATDRQNLSALGSDFILLSENEDELKITQPGRPRPGKKLRVNLARSSWALEQAVILTLQKNNLKPTDYDRACRMLLHAVRHDLYFKSKLRKLPSFRLYDLLAALSVRFKRDEYLEELLKLVDANGNGELFRSRKEKWSNPDGIWHKNWSNLKRSKKWAGLSL